MSKLGIEETVVRSGRGLSIAGTRITLYQIMDFLKAGWSQQRIQEWLNLSDAQMADVMHYIDLHRAEVEAEYEHVVHQAEEIRSYWEERNRDRLEHVAALSPKPGYEEAIAKLQARKVELRGT